MALEAIDVVRHLTVIEGGRKRGRPSHDDEARLELAMRANEEQAQADVVLPLLRRLELLAHEHGPAAHQLVAAVAYWHQRHARRWSGDDGSAA